MTDFVEQYGNLKFGEFIYGPIPLMATANMLLVYYENNEPVQYIVSKNYDYGHRTGYLDTDDKDRTVDASLHSLTGTRKHKYELQFSYVPQEQVIALTDIWERQGSVYLYLDGVNLDAKVKIMKSPLAESQPVFDPITRVPLYSFDLYMEEI